MSQETDKRARGAAVLYAATRIIRNAIEPALMSIAPLTTVEIDQAQLLAAIMINAATAELARESGECDDLDGFVEITAVQALAVLEGTGRCSLGDLERIRQSLGLCDHRESHTGSDVEICLRCRAWRKVGNDRLPLRGDAGCWRDN